ncbi:hypothetical protein EJ04DRAFT_13062 [Polyplosphaeria fusca]|uniref:Uncharacterized protein n=1 Tax=Polyplosphaeria fusca TaxID=682080 RepID=A0A9P4QTH4_9PLEO|nr:hypothetical protein EJ04DRAFT_13062 [Polyplosphaeria fusca]
MLRHTHRKVKLIWQDLRFSRWLPQSCRSLNVCHILAPLHLCTCAHQETSERVSCSRKTKSNHMRSVAVKITAVTPPNHSCLTPPHPGTRNMSSTKMHANVQPFLRSDKEKHETQSWAQTHAQATIDCESGIVRDSDQRQ